MDIYTGEKLKKFISGSNLPKKSRFCFRQLSDYLNSTDSKVCCLYGLRRTGKTVLMKQAIKEINDFNNSIYIYCRKEDSMRTLQEAIEEYQCQNVFIDEITDIPWFIDDSAWLADLYSSAGFRVVVAGTDSLGFLLASNHGLFNRILLLHTTYIPYREYEYLLDKNLQNYLEYGGTLTDGREFYNSTILTDDPYSEYYGDSLSEYTNSSIVRNIAHSLAHWEGGRNPFYSDKKTGELAAYIARAVAGENERFVESVLQDNFTIDALGALRDFSEKKGIHFERCTYEILKEKFTDGIHAMRNMVSIPDQKTADALRWYLEKMDILVNISPKWQEPKFVFTQPGLRYAQAQELTDILLYKKEMSHYPVEEKQILREQAIQGIEGHLLEEIILSDLLLDPELSDTYDICKYRNDMTGKEFDVTIKDKATRLACVMEIKHSQKCIPEQAKFLTDPNFCGEFESNFGCKIVCRMVIYNGPDTYIAGEMPVFYVNATEFLRRDVSFQKMRKSLHEENKEEKEDREEFSLD